MENFLNKKYRIDRVDDGYEAYLEAIGRFIQMPSVHWIICLLKHIFLGVNAENRKLAKESKATFQLVKTSANEYTFNTDIGIKVFETQFVLNQETERTTLDGRKVKSTFTIDGNKLIERQVESSRDVVTTRTFSNTELVNESVVDGITGRVWAVLVE